mmetsp:Transcript_12183/g.16993  ORF Transcript_12183/g.16993 Transcript_12183/m.16993 type:complete len:562 (+) Transcript_12183:57-1742(+)
MAPRSNNGAKHLKNTRFISFTVFLLSHFVGVRLAGAFQVPAHRHYSTFKSRSSPLVEHQSLITGNGKRFTSTSLTTKDKDGEQGKLPGPFSRAISKFKARPGTYLLIPCVAAVVGWVTNWLAVQMIFYPVKFRGIPILIKKEVPLGLLGWQGIVPCKTRPMSEAMVNMVTEQLLSVKEAFALLDPRKVASLLAPEVPKLGEEVAGDLFPKALVGVPRAVFVGLPSSSKDVISHFNHRFLHDFTVAVQTNIDSLFNIKNCVVDQMVLDRTLLGQLFRKCGQKELDFLTNSGLWFGFLLGLIQMVVALFWDNPWSLSIGGGIVGLATNWLALKWIFEPVNPTKIGPFVLQGQFLRRQKEVAKEFSAFFANNVLTSEKVWHSILTDPETTPAFHKVFKEHFQNFVKKVTTGLAVTPEPEVLALAAQKAITKLPDHVHVLHSYVDKTLNLQETLRIKMELMTSAQFERVLHPIFEEDELTLILAGAALGFAAGLVQQGLETGKIKLPNFFAVFKKLFIKLKLRGSAVYQRIRRPRRAVSANRASTDDKDASNSSSSENADKENKE